MKHFQNNYIVQNSVFSRAKQILSNTSYRTYMYMHFLLIFCLEDLHWIKKRQKHAATELETRSLQIIDRHSIVKILNVHIFYIKHVHIYQYFIIYKFKQQHNFL